MTRLPLAWISTRRRVTAARPAPSLGRALGLAGGLLALAFAGAGSATAADARVIQLTQVACQFIESENGVNHGFESQSKADCQAINARTGAERLAEAKVLRLEPGTYVFEVTNRDVPYTLGFWLREKGFNPNNPLHHATKTSVSGGGLDAGETQRYEVTLEPGEYVYSCPLNPTPDYRLVVES